MSSLRRRLILGSAATTLVAVGLAATAVATADHVLSMRAVDRGLAAEMRGARFRAIGGITFRWGRDDRERDEAKQDDDAPPAEREPQRQDDELIAAWSLGEEERSYRSTGVDAELAAALLAALPADGAATLRAPDGRLLRAARSTIDQLPRFPRRHRGGDGDERDEPSSVLPITVILAEDIGPVAAGLVQRRWLLGATLAAATALAALGAWLLSRGLLRPLRLLGERIAATEAAPTAEAITLADAPDELVPVVDRLNELLERVAAAVARERRVNADIAHELRTPLAGLRSQLEFALADDDDADLRDAATTSLGIAVQMQELVENLLTLVRLDAEQAAPRRETVHPAAMIAGRWRELSGRAADRGITLRSTVGDWTELDTDGAKLRLVVGNLLANAVAHAPAGSSIEVTLQDRELRVTNPLAEGADPELAARATEPFWRGDVARSDTGLHCGLGLSICHRLCAAIGGELRIATQGGRFEARVVLPPPDPPLPT